jgi:starvation-inducible DNA-binding protein
MAEHSDQRFVTDELQDLLCLAVVGDHVRWVLIDDGQPELAEWLIDATAAWRAWADQLAKHLVRLGVAPDGRVRSLARDIPSNWVPDGWLSLDEARLLVADRLRRLAEWARARRSQATEPGSVRLLGVISTGLETQVANLPIGERR